jgi:hypothetical protein
MAKATQGSSTPTAPQAKQVTAAPFNTDGEIFVMGRRLIELDRQVAQFDAAAVRSRRLRRDSEAKEAHSRMDEACEEYSELEWKLAYWPAATPEGHFEKIIILERTGFSFEPDDVADIMWRLAHEAGRLGLGDTIPRRCRKFFGAAHRDAE